MNRIWVLAFVMAIAFCGCPRKGPAGSVAVEKVKVIEGLDLPECLVIDPDSGNIFVSNVVTPNKGYWDKDKNGFISKLAADGTILQLRWLESTDDMAIDGPKGMCIANGNLYFNDVDTLKYRSLDGTGAVGVIPIDGSVKLNDMAAAGGVIWVTDTARGKAFRIAPDGAMREIPAPESVNGITFHDGKLFAVSWGLHEVYELDPAGVKKPVAFGLADNFVALDGIEVLADGSFIVSDYKGNMLYSISADRKTITELIELESPADFAIDRENDLLYVPEMLKSRAVILKIK